MTLRRRAYLGEKRDYEVEIRKASSGYGRWQVWKTGMSNVYPPDALVRKCKTKKEATLLMKAMDGDRASAKAWYRFLIAQYVKDGKTEKEAWGEAAQDAYLHGFSPSMVGADPETYEPK